MRNFSRSASIAFLSLFVPFIASAQTITSLTTLVSALVNYALGLMIGLAILGFGYGILKYFFIGAGSPEAKKSATKYMLNGIIAIAVLLSIYGLVRLLQNTFGVGNNATIPPPSIGQLQISQN